MEGLTPNRNVLQDDTNAVTSDLPSIVERIEIAEGETMVIPLQAETITIDKQAFERGVVQIIKSVNTREVLVNETLFEESVDVTHVPINQVVTDMPHARQEGDIYIVPVLEEVLVVEKRLMLKEELHITRRRTERRDPQTVLLRDEQIEVNRVEPSEGS